MTTLKTVRITLSPQSQAEQRLRPQCYLIIVANNQEFFTRTVLPNQRTYVWQINQEQLNISSKPKGMSLQLRLIDYSSCKQRGRFQIQLMEHAVSNTNNIYEQIFNESSSLQATVAFQFDFQEGKESKYEQNIGVVSRNSKKTKTTTYEDSYLTSILEKVSSLKQIANYPRERCPASPTHSPKNIRELAYLRSYRQNLEKKLYTSIEFEARTMKRYIV